VKKKNIDIKSLKKDLKNVKYFKKIVPSPQVSVRAFRENLKNLTYGSLIFLYGDDPTSDNFYYVTTRKVEILKKEKIWIGHKLLS
jgi:hypothetical protein